MPADGPETLHGGTVTRAWLHRFALATRLATLSTLTVTNTCIFTTRIACEALNQVGIKGRAMPVFTLVMNREAYLLSQQQVPVADWPHSAHSVGVTETSTLPRAAGWNGHLVLIVRQPGQPRLLIDLTADQFSRPIRNLIVNGPIFMDIPADKPWTPRDPLYTVAHTEPDAGEPHTVISYRPMPPQHPEAKRWRTAPDWNPTRGDVEEFVEQILKITNDESVPLTR